VTPEELERLLEAATSASRQRDTAGRLIPSADWLDLDPAQRVVLFERQMEARLVERAVDEERLSSTAREVIEHVAGLGQL